MYRIKTSERNNDKATEYETKSLLYLLTKINGREGIDVFIIDCFNDVTGVKSDFTESWDVQSKGVTSLSPKTIGIALYTLFANYVSDIDFTHYLLFFPPIKELYINDPSLENFNITNFKKEKIPKIKEGLENEIVRRNDPEVNNISNLLSIDDFLNKVVFIVDRYHKADYIKSIIEFKNVNRLDEVFLNKIFDEIRILQSAKKIPNVYNQEVNTIQETYDFNKTLFRKDIELLVVNRVVGNNLFSKNGIPTYFIQEVIGMDEEDIFDLIQECQTKLSRTLFNKNNKKAFWLLLEKIMLELAHDPSATIHDINSTINSDLRDNVFTLDDKALLYLIALVKEGVHNENT